MPTNPVYAVSDIYKYIHSYVIMKLNMANGIVQILRQKYYIYVYIEYKKKKVYMYIYGICTYTCYMYICVYMYIYRYKIEKSKQ